MSTFEELPQGLPAPHDDGATDHLSGGLVPSRSLPGTSGDPVDLSARQHLNVVYIYPMTGRPGEPLPDGWDAIPGARGCTPESCGFRDHLADLNAAGVTAVFGISSQSTEQQREARERLRLPFELLSDADFAWADELRLPTFIAADRRFHQRLTLLVRDGSIEHVFYPVFPPDEHAGEVVAWLRSNRANR